MKKGKPSTTAYKVAMNIIVLGLKPGMEDILPAGTVEATKKLIVASGAAPERNVRIASSKFMLSVCELFNFMMPGQFVGFAQRKAFCDRQVRDGIADGATQVLVLGAGYDTLGWLLSPEFPNVNFFEIDHPATAKAKAEGINKMGTRDNLHLIPEDLSRKILVDVLNANEVWDQNAKTVIIAEGLVMYLPPDAVRDMFCQCSQICKKGSRIAFSYIPSGKDGKTDAGPWTWLVTWSLMKQGEPWLWSIKEDRLEPFLKETGWLLASDKYDNTIKHGIEYFIVAKNTAKQV